MRDHDPDLPHAVMAGVVCALVGFTSSFAAVLPGLAAVGVSPRQASSGLAALTAAVGLGSVAFSWRRRQLITLA